MRVRDDESPSAIRAYLAQRPAASGYHDPAWLDVIGCAFGHRTRYLTAEAEGALCGALPLVLFASRAFGRFAVSLPFVNYGGVVADDERAPRALLDAAVALTRAHGGRHLELRHEQQAFADLPVRRHKVAMRRRLPAAVDSLWQSLDRKVRNQVRKAEKSALDVEHGGDALLPAFYAVFARNMRDLGTPVYGARFFEEVVRAWPARTRVFVVRSGMRPVAGALAYWHGGTFEVPWASTVREFNPLCANMLLYWHLLRFATERGFSTVDFGRSTPGEGTFHFKRQWGAEPQDLAWEYWLDAGAPLPDFSPRSPRYGMAVKAWQRLPLRVATVVGPHIVRNIP